MPLSGGYFYPDVYNASKPQESGSQKKQVSGSLDK